MINTLQAQNPDGAIPVSCHRDIEKSPQSCESVAQPIVVSTQSEDGKLDVLLNPSGRIGTMKKGRDFSTFFGYLKNTYIIEMKESMFQFGSQHIYGNYVHTKCIQNWCIIYYIIIT